MMQRKFFFRAWLLAAIMLMGVGDLWGGSMNARRFNADVPDLSSFSQKVGIDCTNGGTDTPMSLNYSTAVCTVGTTNCFNVTNPSSFDGYIALQDARTTSNGWWLRGNQGGLWAYGGGRAGAVYNLSNTDIVKIDCTQSVTNVMDLDETGIFDIAYSEDLKSVYCTMTADGIVGFYGKKSVGYISAITVYSKSQNFTINYKYNGNTIYSQTGTELVGKEIELPDHVNGYDGNTYYFENTSSVRIVYGTSEYNVECTSMDQGVYAFVKAVDANGNQLALFKSEQSGTMGQQGYVFIDRMVKYNGKWYDYGEKITTDPDQNYRVSVNYGETATRTYSVNNDVAFYQEIEDFTGKSRSNALQQVGEVRERASGGDWRRIYPKAHVWSDAISEAGYYIIVVAARNQHTTSSTVHVRIRLADGTITTPENCDLTWNGSEHSVKTLWNIYVPAGASIDFYNDTDYNTNAALDYVCLVKTNVAAPTLSFSSQTATANIQDLNFTEPTLSVENSNGGNIVYKSSDLNVARVNPLTGDVFLLDGTTKEDPVIITAYLYYTANGVQYTVSANYKLIINVGNDAEFRTEDYKSTAWVAGKYGTRKVESVPNITMYTGNPDETSNVTILQVPNGYDKLAATTLAGDGWHDVQFGIDGQTPTEGSFYTFEPKVDGKLYVTGYSTSGSKPAWIVDANNLASGLQLMDGAGEHTFNLDVLGGHKYYLYGINPYYCHDDYNKISTNTVNVGYQDYSMTFNWNDFNANCSDAYTIGANETLTVFFKMNTNPNVNDGGIDPDDPEWNNWLLQLREGNSGLYLRADYDPSAGGGDFMDGRYSIPVGDYEAMYPYVNGADVKLTISRNREHVTVTVMIKGNNGKTYIKQQLFDSTSANGELTARIHPLRSYLTGFKAYRDDAWNVFKLHSFEFISNYRYEEPSLVYINGNIYAADNLSTPLSENITVTTNGDVVTFKQTLLGVSNNTTYKIDNYGDTDDVTTFDGEFSFDKTKGGAYVMNATTNGVTARYILTIPYKTHKWILGLNSNPMGVITEKKNNGAEWRVNARLKQSDPVTHYMYSFDHTLITSRKTVQNDNVLYFNNSEGLLFNTTASNAIGYSVAQNEGHSCAEYLAVKQSELLQAKKEALMATVAYQNMTETEQEDTISKVKITAQDINRIIYNMYANNDETTVNFEPYSFVDTDGKTKTYNPGDLWLGKGESEFTIPYAKAGQYVKIHWLRYTNHNGSDFKATNLVDLADEPIEDQFGISGYQGGWKNPYGNYIFKVAQDGPVTITKDDNGWVSIADIELTDEYSTDLDLVETNGSSELGRDDKNILSDQPLSLVSNGMSTTTMEFSGYAGHTRAANAMSSQWKLTSEDNINVTGVKQDYISYYGKYVVSVDNNCGHGNVKLTESILDYYGKYVIDKLDTWLAVGTVTPQQYPRTWDFTAQNMNYAEAGKAAMAATANNAQNYGAWNTVTTDATTTYNLTGNTRDTNMSLHTYNAQGGYKPLFANGSELTAGNATFAETIGMGVTMADATAVDQVKLDGEGLDGVKGLSIPMLKSGDYVYVMADAEPAATVQAYTESEGKYTEADGAVVSIQAAKYLGNGVYGFKVTAGDKVNMNLVFEEGTKVYKVGVSNIEKTFDKYGFSTESRDKNIDYSFISAPAYGITDSEFSYNYDQVVVTPTSKFGITPAGSGVMLYNTDLAEDASPLFYAGNNILSGTDNLPQADKTLASANKLVGIVEGGTVNQSQGDSEAFVLTYIYNVWNSTKGSDKLTNQDYGTDAFFRVKGSITAPANKAYLLIPSSQLPLALWDGGDGNGTAGHVKNMVRINFGELDEGELDEPTGINTVADVENLDNATWYNLSGQKLNGRPATAGVYIVNGKKIMVK